MIQSQLVSLFHRGLTLLLVISNFHHAFSLLSPQQKSTDHCDLSRVDPLFLTPLINSKQFDQARKLARVTGFGPPSQVDEKSRDDESGSKSPVTSYSGYLTVDETYNSNIFFWFFPSTAVENKNGSQNSPPLILWLEGGPGDPSSPDAMLNGPFWVDENLTLHHRTEFAWTTTHAVLYMDNPVGTGFSFTDHESGYSKTQEEIAKNLYEALLQFFYLFPEYKSSDFYLTGISYAGKYIPTLGQKIHEENEKFSKTTAKINLKGLLLMNPFTDPLLQSDVADVFHTFGLIDEKSRTILRRREEELKEAIEFEQFDLALKILLDFFEDTQTFSQFTGYTSRYSLLEPSRPLGQSYPREFLGTNLPQVAVNLHVDPCRRSDPGTVFGALAKDIFISAKSALDQLMRVGHYKILIASSALDITVPTVATDNLVRHLEWPKNFKSEKFLETDRRVWRVGGRVAGYSKQLGNFTRVVVINAGHMIPYDQPRIAFEMLNRFTHHSQFNEENFLDGERGGGEVIRVKSGGFEPMF